MLAGLLSSHRPAGAAMRDARGARVGHGAAGPHTGRWLCRERAKPAPSPDAPRSSTVADARGIGARQSSVEAAQAPADTTPAGGAHATRTFAVIHSAPSPAATARRQMSTTSTAWGR